MLIFKVSWFPTAKEHGEKRTENGASQAVVNSERREWAESAAWAGFVHQSFFFELTVILHPIAQLGVSLKAVLNTFDHSKPQSEALPVC